jgi:cell division topological specificity factor
MRLFEYFRTTHKPSAAVAKERLQILIAHERAQRDSPSYLPSLQRDVLEVIRRYVAVDSDAVRVRVGREDNCEVLELNVMLPED